MSEDNRVTVIRDAGGTYLRGPSPALGDVGYWVWRVVALLDPYESVMHESDIAQLLRVEPVHLSHILSDMANIGMVTIEQRGVAEVRLKRGTIVLNAVRGGCWTIQEVMLRTGLSLEGAAKGLAEAVSAREEWVDTGEGGRLFVASVHNFRGRDPVKWVLWSSVDCGENARPEACLWHDEAEMGRRQWAYSLGDDVFVSGFATEKEAESAAVTDVRKRMEEAAIAADASQEVSE